MKEGSNYDMADVVMQNLVKKIIRRSDEEIALKTLDFVLVKLRKSYDFLNYIQVVDNRYNDDFNLIHIDKEINNVPKDVFYQGINRLIKELIGNLGKVADHFFIREYKKSLGSKHEYHLKNSGVNLEKMQSDYILQRQHMFVIKNDDLIEDVLIALIKVVNRSNSFKDTIKILFNVIAKVEKQFDFLKYVKISDVSEKDKTFEILVYPDINDIWTFKLKDGIQMLMKETKRIIQWDDKSSFEDVYKLELGRGQISVLEKIGIDFDELKDISERKSNRDITEKTMQAIIRAIGERTSDSFAAITIDLILTSMKQEYEVLKYITIDKTSKSRDQNPVDVDSKINSIDALNLGFALKELINQIGKNLGMDHKMNFVESIKKKLGRDYLAEFERLGLNLHIIELKLQNS